jgi:hypothetical protein
VSLNYTPLRHKMLAAVERGLVRINDDHTWLAEWTARHGEPT